MTVYYRYWDTPMVPNLSVSDNVRRNTKLLDLNGHKIFKEPNGIGFGVKLENYSVDRS